jgi:IS30 family transposase
MRHRTGIITLLNKVKTKSMPHYDSITKIKICHSLWKNNVSPEEIPEQLGIHRATVYRWIKKFNEMSLGRFIQEYKNAKKGHRKPTKTSLTTRLLIYEIRETYHNCCGEKIKYFLLTDYDIVISVSTIYRILHEKYNLSSKWKKKVKRGSLVKGISPRESLQTDTVDFGEIYAYTCIDTFTKEVSVHLRNDLKAQTGCEVLKCQLQRFKTIKHIQRDGGSEFMAEWEDYAKQHIETIRTSRPYKKNDQAFIERFNGILRKECLGYGNYKKKHLPVLQKRLDEYLDYYHNKRPHLSLDMLTPNKFAMSHLT